MQFPDPWLSDIVKPLFNAVVLSPNNKSVLLLTLLASSCICWSSRMIRSREPRRDKKFFLIWQHERSVTIVSWKITILKQVWVTWRVKRQRRPSTTKQPMFCSTTEHWRDKLQETFYVRTITPITKREEEVKNNLRQGLHSNISV